MKVLNDLIAQVTKDVTDVTENVESIDAPQAAESLVMEEAAPGVADAIRD